jgi:hypothetical protein
MKFVSRWEHHAVVHVNNMVGYEPVRSIRSQSIHIKLVAFVPANSPFCCIPSTD